MTPFIYVYHLQKGTQDLSILTKSQCAGNLEKSDWLFREIENSRQITENQNRISVNNIMKMKKLFEK